MLNINEKQLNLEEIKKISIDILLDITSFCEMNNITYFLSVGTLLGAVRHKGFIPWDDDIDIMMPRPDYNRLLESYKGKYQIIKPEDGFYYYAKAYDPNTIKYEKGIDYKKYQPFGIDIDIFPLDGSINNANVVKTQYKKACFLEMLLRLCLQPIFYRKNPLKCINRLLPRMIGRKQLIKMIEKNAQQYKYENSDYVVRMRRSTNGFAGILPKTVYEPATKVEFEGHLFNAPNDYKKWLEEFFGSDYMELPPIKKRITHICECYKK